MGRIEVHPDDLRGLSRELHRCGEEIRSIGGRLGSAVQSLSWETRLQLHVTDRTGEAQGQAQLLAALLVELAQFLDRKAEAFRQADDASQDRYPTRQILGALQRLAPFLPPWARMTGVSPTEVADLIALGSLGMAPLAAGALTRTIPLSGTGAVEHYLRQAGAPPLEGLVWALPQANRLTSMGQLVGLQRKTLVSGQPTGLDGVTLGRTKLTLPDERGIQAEFDLLHVEKKPTPSITAQAGVGHFSANVETFDLKKALKEGEFRARVEAGGSLLHGQVDARIVGNDAVNLGAGAQGALLGARGELGAGTDGVSAQGYAYVAQGQVSATVKVFSWSVKVGVKGCAACVGGGFKMDWGGNSGELGLAAVLGGRIFWDID